MITLDRHHLPTSVPTLHGIILQLLDVVDEQRQIIAKQQAIIIKHEAVIVAQQRIIEQQQQTIQAQQQQIELLTQRVAVLEKQLYGKRTERRHGNVSAPVAECDNPTPFVGHGRRVLPDHLPRVREDYEVDNKICAECGDTLSTMGNLTSEQLDCLPSQLYVIQHVRHKYTCRKCQGRVLTAPMPAQPIDKGLPASGLLAEVLVNKYHDALPLYRQAGRFKRSGLIINRSTLCEWVMHCAGLLQPLVAWMTQHHLKPLGHLHTDDTPIRMLKNSEDQSATGRFWIYTSKGKVQDGNSYPACTVYQFTPHRQASAPHAFLQDFKGYLQADAYSGYDDLYKEKDGKGVAVIEVACWAHARRYFIESAHGTADDNPVHEALHYIGQLYAIEREGRDRSCDAETLRQQRLERAPPILEALHQWLLAHKSQVLPKSTLAIAINYTLNHWQALNVYITNGHLEIDNNRSERGLRPLVVGRKNYMFVGNNKGGQVAAVIYSLIETCKQHNVNPWFYLKDVLSRISTHPQSRIEELLPYNWQPQPASANTNLKLLIPLAA